MARATTCAFNFALCGLSVSIIRRVATFYYIFRQAKPCYNACTMQVYAEYAFAENFCMDFTLLFAAKAATKNPTGYWRIAIAAALGACFAIAYPLFGIDGTAGIAVKLASGAAMCGLAGKFNSFKGYLKFTAVFSAVTFLLGGALIAVFSLAGISYGEGGGYIISSVPIGIPMFAALALALIIKKIRSKFVANKAIAAHCKIFMGGKSAACNGFYDSGNKVYMGGVPVSIVPPYVARQLVKVDGIKTFVDIHTVAGKSRIKVFTADKVEIDDGTKVITRQNVAFGVSPRHVAKIVLHPDLSEVN